jgi:hypothetical protein
MSTITNYADLQAYVGSNDVARRLFKDTDCGICFDHDEAGVSVAGYAEGADAECQSIRLEYPFTGIEFDRAVVVADEEGCAMWHEWNEEN